MGSTAVISEMLANSTDLNAADDGGRTALYFAAYYGQADAATMLISRGAHFNVKTESGQSPLSAAVHEHQIALVSLFLAHGADPNYADNQGHSLLEVGFAHSNEESHNDPGSVKSVGELLLSKGANVNAADKRGRTPLMTASTWADPQFARLLLDRGADVRAKDEDGLTPLTLAVEQHEVELVKLLLTYGADVNATDKQGDSPLRQSFFHKKSDPDNIHGSVMSIAELLLSHGANVNAVDNAGNTALMAASNWADPQFARLLLDRGADVNASAKNGDTPLINVFLHQPSGNDPDAGKVKAVAELLLSRGANVNAGRGGALMLACTWADSQLAAFLLDRGADPELRDDGGNTALSYAAGITKKHSSKAAVDLLLSHHVEVNPKNKFGRTPLQIAVDLPDNDIAELLRQHGAR